MIDLSIIVVTYNSATDIRECLDSIERAKGRLSIEVTVVDNASVDGTVDLVRQGYPRVKLIANKHNDGFSCANNQAMILSEARNIMLLNPDTIVHDGALERIVEFMDGHPNVGVCGPRLCDKRAVEAPDLRGPSLWIYLLESVGLDACLRSRIPLDKVE